MVHLPHVRSGLGLTMWAVLLEASQGCEDAAVPREPLWLGCACARSWGLCSFLGQQNEQRLSVWAPAPAPAAGWWSPSEAMCLCTCEKLRLARLLFHWLQPLRLRECLPVCACLSSLACRRQTFPRPQCCRW